MKHIYLLAIAMIYSIVANGQTYTIAQSSTGMTQTVFGQGFTPSVQGDGSGDMGTQDQVALKEFSFMLDADEKPEVLYIYEVLPSSKEVLIDGTGGTLVGQSTSKTEESYWYTNYQFNDLTLDKNKMYYALFRESVTCEVGGGAYSGGNIYRLGSDGELNTTTYANTKFKATFSITTSTDIENQDVSKINIYPNPTKGEITITAEKNTLIDVFALTGVKVKTLQVKEGENKKSVADLPNGIFIFLNDGKTIGKVIKQ